MDQQQTTSKGITAATTTVSLVVFAGYMVASYYLFRFSKVNPKPVNRNSGMVLQRIVPLFYVFLILIGLIEVSISAWLLAQYHHIGSFPNVGARDGVRLVVFSTCWTMLFSTIYSFLFVHPTLSEHPLSSLGSQALWSLLTWCFWVASSATLNRALPLITLHASCAGSVYCGQLQAIFAFAVIYVLSFTLAMLVIGWLIWSNFSRGTSQYKH